MSLSPRLISATAALCALAMIPAQLASASPATVPQDSVAPSTLPATVPLPPPSTLPALTPGACTDDATEPTTSDPTATTTVATDADGTMPTPELPAPTVACSTPMSASDMLAALLPPLSSPGDAAGAAALRERYGSLSSALGAMYLSTGAAPAEVGLSTDVPSLAMSGSLASFSGALSAHSTDVSAAVVTAGAEWASQLEQLRVPTLETPSMAAPSIEHVAFGAFANQAVTAMVTDFPDLFAASRDTGSPEAMAAWRTSMNNAMAASAAEMTAALPSPCHAALLTAMGSGDATAAIRTGGADCGSCVATGLYMNGQMSRLFDPSRTSTSFDPADNLLPPAEFNQLQPWQRSAIVTQNPSLASQLPAATSSAPATGCGGSAASSSAAQVVLPGVFAALD